LFRGRIRTAHGLQGDAKIDERLAKATEYQAHERLETNSGEWMYSDGGDTDLRSARRYGADDAETVCKNFPCCGESKEAEERDRRRIVGGWFFFDGRRLWFVAVGGFLAIFLDGRLFLFPEHAEW
jgi:hypothetical protein